MGNPWYDVQVSSEDEDQIVLSLGDYVFSLDSDTAEEIGINLLAASNSVAEPNIEFGDPEDEFGVG